MKTTEMSTTNSARVLLSKIDEDDNSAAVQEIDNNTVNELLSSVRNSQMLPESHLKNTSASSILRSLNVYSPIINGSYQIPISQLKIPSHIDDDDEEPLPKETPVMNSPMNSGGIERKSEMNLDLSDDTRPNSNDDENRSAINQKILNPTSPTTIYYIGYPNFEEPRPRSLQLQLDPKGKSYHWPRYETFPSGRSRSLSSGNSRDIINESQMTSTPSATTNRATSSADARIETDKKDTTLFLPNEIPLRLSLTVNGDAEKKSHPVTINEGVPLNTDLFKEDTKDIPSYPGMC